ncbi:hypothetical protein BJ742DRAFT_772433 [Cladochytrium replicatum]|nr:hypothetical protein BJ742DRAFT_772433 [Cladochytrium replicatum]
MQLDPKHAIASSTTIQRQWVRFSGGDLYHPAYFKCGDCAEKAERKGTGDTSRRISSSAAAPADHAAADLRPLPQSPSHLPPLLQNGLEPVVCDPRVATEDIAGFEADLQETREQLEASRRDQATGFTMCGETASKLTQSWWPSKQIHKNRPTVAKRRTPHLNSRIRIRAHPRVPVRQSPRAVVPSRSSTVSMMKKSTEVLADGEEHQRDKRTSGQGWKSTVHKVTNAPTEILKKATQPLGGGKSGGVVSPGMGTSGPGLKSEKAMPRSQNDLSRVSESKEGNIAVISSSTIIGGRGTAIVVLRNFGGEEMRCDGCGFHARTKCAPANCSGNMTKV